MDNYSQWEAKTRREERWLAKLPVCEYCGHHIQSGKVLPLDGLVVHADCFMEEHAVDVEDYIN